MKLIGLCYLTDDQIAIEIVDRYWQQKDEKSWSEKVDLIALQFGMSKNSLITFVQSAAKAFDLKSRCYWCKAPEELKSRASFTSTYRSHFTFYQSMDGRKGLCPACQHQFEMRQRDLQQRSLEEKKLKLRDHLRRLQLITPQINEEKISNTDAILLLALILAADQLSSKNNVLKFRQAVPVAASATVTNKIYARLFRIGAILPEVDNNIEEFEFDEKGQLVFDFQRIDWTLSKALQEKPCNQLCEKLEMRLTKVKSDPETLQALWEYASIAECESYLLERANHYKFSNYAIGERTVIAFKHALENYSIPQVWQMIFSSTQYAAAQKQSKAINGRHAQNLVPSSIIGFADRARKEGWNVRSRPRQNWMDESILTNIFFNRILANNSEGLHSTTSKKISELCAVYSSTTASDLATKFMS